jgi:hypothetical protein
MRMPGRRRPAAVRALGAVAAVLAAGAAAGGCSPSGTSASPAPSRPQTSAAPPVGSVNHPRPVDCGDGATVAPSAPAKGRPGATGAAVRPPGRHASPTATPWDPSVKDVRVGPLTLPGLLGLSRGNQYTHGIRNSEGWHYLLGAVVGAGAEVTVTVGAEERARAGLEFGGTRGMTPAPAVTFHGCPDGPTSFLGGFFIAGDGKACLPLEIRVGDGAIQRVVISFYNGRCPA